MEVVQYIEGYSVHQYCGGIASVLWGMASGGCCMAFILTLTAWITEGEVSKSCWGSAVLLWSGRLVLGGEYTGQDVAGEAERADLPQLFTGNGSGGWHIDSGSDRGADSSDGPCISSI